MVNENNYILILTTKWFGPAMVICGGSTKAIATGDIYYAAGFGGNFSVVDEQNDLVTVTRWLQPSHIGAFVKKVYEAM